MASTRACVLPMLLAVAVLLLVEQIALSSADFPLGGQATVQLPPAPCQPGFAARAVVLDTQGHRQPAFVAAVSAAEAGAGRCTCSLVVLLGGVKVWASDHLEKFVPAALCRLELTEDGQLRLTDGAGKVGWLSGTAGQGVKALHLDRKTGNLILLDAQNCIRWQSLDDPTDTFLRGQQRRLPVHLIAPTTKAAAASSVFYSLELDGDKVAAYINFGDTRYSYWELPSPANRTMASARLNGSGLRLLDLQGATVAQITPPVKKPPVSFLALAGDDGNLVMYYYDTQHQKFRASYKALGFCELPLSCSIHEVCSSAGKCKDFSDYADRPPARAAGNASSSSSNPCEGDGDKACMVHLRGVTTVLRTASPALTNVTLRECVVECARNLSCNAALYVKDDAGGVAAAADDHGVCSHYTLTAGAREVTDGSHLRYSYWVKFPAAAGGGDDDDDDDDSSLGKLSTGTILMICGAIDVVCAVVFVVLIAMYFRRLRRLAAAVDRVVELQEGAAEGVGEQNDTDGNGSGHN
ncbi:hypothetical protein BDA96_03G367600 [Sorghum bicolor]|uniref:non-specific serine/threonine protein kinase n=3 Tax=Sorghum bicolor TaxID=4558 RepID=A0A1B6Q6T1_SORBI|nr:hypothetical protein BDA96_03G367600 [Sorghum bicolor]KXG33633.1 hypothetical protein SORBI_3003G340500 [Sorghum bicolor]